MIRRTLLSLGMSAVMFITAARANDPINSLYRASYSPRDQQRDIEARMVRELVPPLTARLIPRSNLTHF